MIGLASVFIVLLAALDAPAQPPAKVCNGLAIDVTSVSFDNAKGAGGPPVLLHPGQCSVFRGLPAGVYTLRFIERSGEQAALCVREVSLKPGDQIRISTDDGAKCMH